MNRLQKLAEDQELSFDQCADRFCGRVQLPRAPTPFPSLVLPVSDVDMMKLRMQLSDANPMQQHAHLSTMSQFTVHVCRACAPEPMHSHERQDDDKAASQALPAMGGAEVHNSIARCHDSGPQAMRCADLQQAGAHPQHITELPDDGAPSTDCSAGIAPTAGVCQDGSGTTAPKTGERDANLPRQQTLAQRPVVVPKAVPLGFQAFVADHDGCQAFDIMAWFLTGRSFEPSPILPRCAPYAEAPHGPHGAAAVHRCAKQGCASSTQHGKRSRGKADGKNRGGKGHAPRPHDAPAVTTVQARCSARTAGLRHREADLAFVKNAAAGARGHIHEEAVSGTGLGHSSPNRSRHAQATGAWQSAVQVGSGNDGQGNSQSTGRGRAGRWHAGRVQEGAVQKQGKKKRAGRMVRELAATEAAGKNGMVELGFNAHLKQFEKAQREKGVFKNRQRARPSVYTVSGMPQPE